MEYLVKPENPNNRGVCGVEVCPVNIVCGVVVCGVNIEPCVMNTCVSNF